jgi:hypothetical protein
MKIEDIKIEPVKYDTYCKNSDINYRLRTIAKNQAELLKAIKLLYEKLEGVRGVDRDAHKSKQR